MKNLYYQPEFDSETQWHNFKIQQINAALSIIVQLMVLIADITNTDYKYKMVLQGNQSYIVDEISKDYPITKKLLVMGMARAHTDSPCIMILQLMKK